MTSVKKMSPSKLASLKTGPSINILFSDSQNSQPAMLCEGFPKQLAIAFSRLCRQTFPPITGMSIADMSKPRSNNLVLSGGNIDAHKAVLSWMLACCEGRGMQPFPFIYHRRFWHYTCALESAELMEIEVLREELWGRLTEISNLQVHSEDVQAIYTHTEEGHPMRGMVAESIGRALVDRRLAARSAYDFLRQDTKFKDFDDDVNAAIEKIKKQYFESDEGKAVIAAKRAARKATKEAAQKRYQRLHNNPQNLSAADIAEELDVPEEAVRSEEDGRFNITVMTEIVRKGRNGRGRYAALPLRQAGVTAEAFRPAPSPDAPHRAANNKTMQRQMHGTSTNRDT